MNRRIARVPSLHHSKEGWLRHKTKCREASFAGADGVVFLACFDRKTTPAARSADATRYFLDRSATPPCCGARRGFCTPAIHSASRVSGFVFFPLHGITPIPQEKPAASAPPHPRITFLSSLLFNVGLAGA